MTREEFLNMKIEPGELDGLYGRLPPDLKMLVRRVADADYYDLAAMIFLDSFTDIEWRKDPPPEPKLDHVSDATFETYDLPKGKWVTPSGTWWEPE
jgi:hypothetical protein